MVSRVLNNKNKKTMKKFYLKNGEEVQIGDTITRVTNTKHPLLGKCTTTENILVTKTVIPELIKNGILSTSEGSDYDATKALNSAGKLNDPDINCCINRLAERLGWKVEKVCNYLNTITSVYPTAAFSIILREIAIELDKKYEDHIKNSPEIYVISLLNGKITKANKAHIKNYRNFAAFRTVDDAKIACRILKELLKDLFKSGK